MGRKLLILAPAVCLVLLSATARAEEGRFANLLSRVPADANTLIMVDAAKLRESDFSKKHGTISEAAREAHGSIFPRSEIERAVLASNLTPGSFAPQWELSMVATRTDPAFEWIAGAAGGKADTLAGLPAIAMPDGTYLVKFAPKLVGLLNAVDRQSVSRWARQAQAPEGVELSPYLRAMSKFPEATGTELIMALDLTDAVSQAAAKENLAKLKSLAGSEVDLGALAKLASGMRGVTLGVRFTDKAAASLRIDFSDDAAVLAPMAKPLILEELASLGAYLEDLEDWTVEVRGPTVYLVGELSISGLRRVASLIDPPSPRLAEGEQAPAVKPDGKPRAKPDVPDPEVDPKRQPTIEHFRAVRTLLEDVKKFDKDNMITSGQFALWLERYARKIDELPILNVDSEVIDYSAGVAKALRAMALKFKGVGIKAGMYSRNPSTVSGYSGGPVQNYNRWYGPGGMGWYWERPGPSSYNIVKKMGTSYAAASYQQLAAAIADETAELRRTLTQRYQVEF